MCMPKVNVPEAPPPPPPPPTPPTLVDASVRQARDDEKRRAKAAYGRSGTVVTGGQGASGQANVGAPTLLGG